MCKSIQYSEAFGVVSRDFKILGVFNGFVNKDANFYIAPHMIEGSQIDEFKDSYNKYKKYFSDILRVVKFSKKENDIFYKKTSEMFIFHEIAHCGLGYSKTGKKGSGIGLKIAKQLTRTALQIVEAGIEDPEIFELLGLMEEGIGADRISDMTLSILIKDFLLYTQRVSLSLKLNVDEYKYKEENYRLPYYQGEPIVFLPEEFILALPIAIDYNDISRVCEHNNALRDRVNAIIGDAMKNGSKMLKYQFKALLLKEPKIARELIALIKKEQSSPYNFNEDPKGEIIWKELAEEYSKKFPLSIDKEISTVDVVKSICNKYKDLIENNDLFKSFHNSDGKHKNEAFAQRLFFAIAVSYCEANNLDISPESNAGRGPVDFKISQGNNDKVNVEMKLSTNNIMQGFKKQLPIYNKAEKVQNSFFLVILLDERNTRKIENLYTYKRKLKSLDTSSPEIIVIDATMKKSASKS